MSSDATPNADLNETAAAQDTADSEARTTGSSDFKKFVSDLLSQTWQRAKPAPAGVGLPNLQRLLAFLDHISSLEATQQSHFGPSKSSLLTLFLRLFGEQASGTKVTVFQSLRERVQEVIDTWPTAQSANIQSSGTMDPPVPPPVAATADTVAGASTADATTDESFWQQFAQPVPPPEPVYRSILADEASISPSALAKGLYEELPFFLPLPALRGFF